MDRVRAKLGGRKAAKSSAHHDDDRATPPEDSDSRRARDMGEGRSSDSAGSSSGGGRGGVMGLTQLWPDPAIESISKVETDVDVIAIHGLGGHPFKTWSEGEKLWLRDFLPYSASKTRIMTFGYNSAVAFSGSRSTIRDFAIQLLEDIKQVRRRDKESERKIIFICHSLGGIVFKQALIVAHEKEMRYRTIGDSVTGVVFLGTPHRGADIAYWTKLLAKFANVPLLGGIRKDLLGSLEPKSKELGTICAQFVERGMKLQIFSLYERHNLPGLGSLVVDDFSAILHLPNETPIPIDADHRSMCRYLTSSDRNYLTVANCIGELIDATSGPSTQSYVDVSVRNFLWFYLRAVDATAILERIPVHWGKSSRWFMEHPEFKSWTTPAGRQAIWLFGPPGSGKTVLLRSVIASLSARADDRETSVICKPIYFFFDDKDPSRRTSDTFVRSVLKQILEDTRTSHVFRYLEGFDFKTTATNENGLWKCLSAIVEKSRGIMFQLVIDAVDEVMRHSAGSPDNIIDRLQRLLALDPSGRLRLMISDRRPPSYEFSRVADVAPISIDNDDTKSSVQEWVEAQVRKSLEASKVAYSAGEPLEERIMDVSQSNFLYARLAWEQASAGVKTWSRQRVKEAIARLDTVSHDLIEVYCRLLKTIPATYKERAKIAFTVLRLCREGLTFEQLAFLEALHGEDFSRRTPTISEVRAKAADLRQYLSEACGYLVRASKDGMVNFTHVSVKDVFSANLEDVPKENRKILTDFSVSDQAGNAIMLDLCMKIFTLEDRSVSVWDDQVTKLTDTLQDPGLTFTRDELNASGALRIRKKKLITAMGKTPCFVYGIRHWLEHYISGSSDGNTSLDKTVTQFAAKSTGYFIHVLWDNLDVDDGPVVLKKLPDTHLTRDYSEGAALFRVIARGDCPKIVKAFLRRGINPNSTNSEKDLISLLSWTILCERKESFRVLLRQEDTNVNFGQGMVPKALHHAAGLTNDSFYLRKLIDYPGTNLNAQSGSGTPLHVAISTPNIEGANILLDCQYVDVWAKNRDGVTTYSLAFRNPIWESTLGKMIDKGGRGHRPFDEVISGGSQFIVAGVHGWVGMEERILKYDPDQIFVIDYQTNMNALSFYAYYGRKEKVLWILDRLPRHVTKLRSSADQYDFLALCANQNWEDVVHLIQRRYKIKYLASDHVGRSLLHWALDFNWEMGIIDFSDFSVAALNAVDQNGQAPIHLAIETRNLAALELLVTSGADPMLKDRHGRTAAHLAADMGYRAGLEYLIELPDREYGRTREGASVLHLIAIWFNHELVEKFIRTKRARVNVVDNHRRTPLHYAAMSNNDETVAALLQLGASINARDESGMTPLHEAIRCGAVESALVLLDNGADYMTTDSFKQTCLHLSLRYGCDVLVSEFLELGLDIRAVDRFGMTPLHRACSRGNVQHVWMLLQKGASFKTKNHFARRPVDLAVEWHHADAVKSVLSWIDGCGVSVEGRRTLLDNALRLALELEFSNIAGDLKAAGAVFNGTVKVRRLYMEGPKPSKRWPLAPYSPPNPFHYQVTPDSDYPNYFGYQGFADGMRSPPPPPPGPEPQQSYYEHGYHKTPSPPRTPNPFNVYPPPPPHMQ